MSLGLCVEVVAVLVDNNDLVQVITDLLVFAILFAEFLERSFEQVLVPPLVGELYVGDCVLLGPPPLVLGPGAQVRHTRAGHHVTA